MSSLEESWPVGAAAATSQGGGQGAHPDTDDWYQLLEVLPQIVWVTRPDGWHVHFNQRWMNFTGLTLADSLGFGWNAPFHPDDRGRAAARWSQATTSGEPYEIEYRLRRHDGLYRWMLGRAMPVRDSDGRVVRWVGTCTDIDDLKRAQALVEHNRSMQRIAGSMARLGGWTLHCAENRLTWSEEMYGILEHLADAEPSVDQLLQAFEHDSAGRLLRALSACSQHGARFDLELELVSGSGRHLWVRVMGEPRYGADGTVEQVIGGLQDISAQQAATRRAEQLADRLVTTLESISDAFYTLDLGWRFTYVNSRAEQLLERRREDLLGTCFWDEFAPALDTDVEWAYRSALAEGRTVVLDEYHYPPLDRWFQVNAYPSEQGLAVYFRDITESRRDQLSLRERMKELRALAAVSGAAHAMGDADLLCEFTARAVVEGMRHPEHVIAEVQLDTVTAGTAVAPAGSSTCSAVVEVDGVEQGRVTVVDTEGCPFLDEERDLVSTIAETLGVWAGRHRAETTLRQVNADLSVANEQLADAAQLKDDLLSMASHELRTPLTPILGFLELVRARGDNLRDDQHLMLEATGRNARRMLRLVDDLLVVSRAGAGRLLPRPSVVELETAVTEAVTELADVLSGVTVDVPAGCHALVDPQHLQQIVTNLLTNAAKYGASPVVVRAVDGDRVLLEVEDSGSGVEPAFRSRMWERFEQKDRGDTRTASGTGLGLAIVRLLAEANDGVAGYRDAVGGGAVFTIELPAAG